MQPVRIFDTVPRIERVERVDFHRYRVTLRDEAGHEATAVFKLVDDSDGRYLTQAESDVFGIWPGDAESMRRVSAAVAAVHRVGLDAGGSGSR